MQRKDPHHSGISRLKIREEETKDESRNPHDQRQMMAEGNRGTPRTVTRYRDDRELVIFTSGQREREYTHEYQRQDFADRQG